MDFIKYQRMLERTYKAVTSDKKDFDLWNNGRITTEECIKRFCENNNHTEEIYNIKAENFEYWLESLGYIKNRLKRKRK